MINIDPVKYQALQAAAFTSLRDKLSEQFDILIDNAAGRVDPNILINVFTEILNATHTAEEKIFDVLSLEVTKQTLLEILK